MLTIVFPLFLVACGENEKENQEDTGDAVDTADPVDTGDADETGETDDTEDTEDASDTGEVNDVQGVCGPRPKGYMANYSVDFFQKMMELESQSCLLENMESDLANDGQVDTTTNYTQPSDMECDADGNCTQNLPSFAVAWSQSNEYDIGSDRPDMYEGVVEGRRILEAGEETIELTITVNSSGSTATRRTVRVYDTLGQVLQETYYFNEDLWFEIENRWENGNLVEQEWYDRVSVQTAQSSLRWTYDQENRLATSSHLNHNGQTHSANFSYDADGQLIGLTRTVDGETWLTQTWTYEGGTLVSRHNTFQPSRLWLTAADNAMMISASNHESHWEHSLETVHGDCTLPPRSTIHGYPDEETVYQLGWSVNDVPNQIGFAYNYDGYGWNYGDLSWFGHEGIASIYSLYGHSEEAEIENTISYQDGMMVREELSAVDGTHQSTIVRNRVVEDGRLLEDEMVVVEERDGDIQNTTQRMVFAYDSDGQLTQRDLYQNDVHTHQSSWRYELGNLMGHTVSAMTDPENDALTVIATYRQTTAERANESERIREKKNGTDWLLVDVYSWGDHSRGRFEKRDERFTIYDADDQIVMVGQGSLDDPNYYHSWTADDRSLLETWSSRTYDGDETRTYFHTCMD